MRKVFLLGVVFLVFFVFALPVQATHRNGRLDCSLSPTQIKSSDNSVTFNIGPTRPGNEYEAEIHLNGTRKCSDTARTRPIRTSGNTVSATFDRIDRCSDRIFAIRPDNFNDISLFERGSRNPICTSTYTVASGCELTMSPTKLDTNTSITVTGSGVPPATGLEALAIRATGASTVGSWISRNANGTFSQTIGPLRSAGEYRIELVVAPASPLPYGNNGTQARCAAITDVTVGPPGDPVENEGKTGTGYTPPGGFLGGFRPDYCGPEESGILTAIGCIPIRDANEFVGWFLRWAMGIAGGIAFVLMLIAGFQIMTASGNPEKVQGGKELLNAAISGLILIIFSVFLLKLIGVDILALPGFNK